MLMVCTGVVWYPMCCDVSGVKVSLVLTECWAGGRSVTGTNCAGLPGPEQHSSH